MRKVIYSLMVTLDGYICGPEEDLGWANVTTDLHQFVNDKQAGHDLHLYGRRTWEIMSETWSVADQWPESSPAEVEFAHIWQAMPKVVVSTTLESVDGNARLIKTNVVEEIRALKAEPGGNINLGGSILAGSLMPHGLIDEYELIVHPVVLGRGKPFFPVLTQQVDLRLLESQVFDTGVVYLRYGSADASHG